MTYYMVFQITDEEGLLVHEPCFDGCRIFMSNSRDVAEAFFLGMSKDFTSSTYKIVSVEV